MIYKRRYVQFNDFVFDDYDMIYDEDSTTSFKYTDTEYTFIHGSYVPLKQPYMLAAAGTVSFTIRMQMKKLPCHVRKFYPQFAITQLTQAGKLWAVQNNTLVWAHAFLIDYTPLIEDSKKDEIRTDVEFFLPEGVWHKADKQRTFLAPYDKCEFMDCYGYKDINPCQKECCSCSTPARDCNCCYCFDVAKEMALCYFDDLQGFYDTCGAGYHIVYDCEAGERYFGGFMGADYFGQKFCAECAPIFGLLYSDTEIPTQGVKITLHGAVSNPGIEINGNANIIEGDYNLLVIYADGSVYEKDECSGCETLIDASAWKIPSGMEYGWTINPGNNKIRIETNSPDCCDLVCAYIEVDALTI